MTNPLPPACSALLNNFRQTRDLGDGVPHQKMPAADAKEFESGLKAEMDMVLANKNHDFSAVDEQTGTVSNAHADGDARSGQLVEVHQNDDTQIVVDTVFRPEGVDSLMLVITDKGYQATATHVGHGKGARSHVQICGEDWNLTS